MGDTATLQLAALAIAATCWAMGVVFLFTLERSRASVSFILNFFAIGGAFATTIPLVDDVAVGAPGWLPRFQCLFEAVVMVASAVYISGLLDRSTARSRAATLATWAVRLGLAEAAWFVLAGFLFPAQRLDDYELSALEPGALGEPGFWLFASTWIVVAITYAAGWLAIARLGVDPAESSRAVATGTASTLLVIATASPPVVCGVLGIVSMACVVWGQVHHVAAQARRGTFLSRFLAPEVTDRVHAEGIDAVMQPHHAELTVVAADLRDFTPYAEGVPSQSVVDLLTEYYEAVGAVVRRHGGTIVNYAGDGILVLVGAPLARDDHAAAGLALSHELFPAVQVVLDRWSTKVHPLGLGVGVASGRVTVGAIGSEGHMEYTAIGVTVNLAARLCSSARAGEILIDENTADLADHPGVVPRDPMRIKGLSELQSVYALTFG